MDPPPVLLVPPSSSSLLDRVGLESDTTRRSRRDNRNELQGWRTVGTVRLHRRNDIRLPGRQAALHRGQTMPPRAHEPLLVTEGVHVSFGGVRALVGVSLAFQPGCIIGLLGPNGAGKSTLFDCLTGLRRPDAGRVTLRGVSLVGRRADQIARLGVARTFQAGGLVPDATVLDNVMLGRHLHLRVGPLAAMLGTPRARRQERDHRGAVADLLATLALSPWAEVPVVSLPHPVRQRVVLARGLASEPSVLLLDEIAAGVDAADKLRIEEVLHRQVAERGVSVVIVEHDGALLMRLCDRLVVLDRGQVIAEGTPAEVGRDRAVRRVYFGEEGR